jgi:hypothetical protein
MFKWFKNFCTTGTVKIRYIAYDDSLPEDQIQPYEDIAIIPYEGKYDEFIIRTKLRKLVRLKKNHLVIEMTVVERIENDKKVYDERKNSKSC